MPSSVKRHLNSHHVRLHVNLPSPLDIPRCLWGLRLKSGDGVPPLTHILLARSPAPYSPFRQRAHSPTAFSGPMARPPPSPPRPLPSHMHGGWMVSATKTPTAQLPRRTVPSNCMCRCSRMRTRLSPPQVLLPHTCTEDGWFLQPKCRPARLPRRTVPSNCICRCSSLPLHILLLHTQVSL
jgi:hypothetical protein